MSTSEITIKSVDKVKISSELISHGGGTYYRNKIKFHLKISEDMTQTEAQNFSTELHYENHEWEVRLVKGQPDRSRFPVPRAAEFSSRNLILEEEVDMNLEDLGNIFYRFPLEAGEAVVSFHIQDGKAQPIVRQ